MAWNVEYTDEFEAWWVGLDEEEQIDIAAVVGLLEEKGPHLPYPYSSDVKGTKFGAIRELRIQHKGKPYRILYVFDPRRAAILLIGGKKTGGARWYEQYVPLAERIYKEHLKSLKMNKGVHYEQTILYIERENETRSKKKSSGEDKDLT